MTLISQSKASVRYTSRHTELNKLTEGCIFHRCHYCRSFLKLFRRIKIYEKVNLFICNELRYVIIHMIIHQMTILVMHNLVKIGEVWGDWGQSKTDREDEKSLISKIDQKFMEIGSLEDLQKTQFFSSQ